MSPLNLVFLSDIEDVDEDLFFHLSLGAFFICLLFGFVFTMTWLVIGPIPRFCHFSLSDGCCVVSALYAMKECIVGFCNYTVSNSKSWTTTPCSSRGLFCWCGSRSPCGSLTINIWLFVFQYAICDAISSILAFCTDSDLIKNVIGDTFILILKHWKSVFKSNPNL